MFVGFNFIWITSKNCYKKSTKFGKKFKTEFNLLPLLEKKYLFQEKRTDSEKKKLLYLYSSLKPKALIYFVKIVILLYAVCI